MRRVVSRRDQIDVVRMLLLKFKKDLRQPLLGDLNSCLPGRDLPVLAKNALQRAAAEKDSARTVCAGNTRLLPEMECRPRQLDVRTLPAYAVHPRRPVHAARSRTEHTCIISLHFHIITTLQFRGISLLIPPDKITIFLVKMKVFHRRFYK